MGGAGWMMDCVQLNVGVSVGVRVMVSGWWIVCNRMWVVRLGVWVVVSAWWIVCSRMWVVSIGVWVVVVDCM